MDLLAIIQDRINAKLTSMGISVDHGTGRESAGTHDVSEIEAIDTLIENTSRTVGHDAYDAFSETVMTVARTSPPAAVINKHVMPESSQPLKANPTPTGKSEPQSNVNAAWPPDVQSLVDWFLTLEPRLISPFHLEDHRHISDPVKFCAALRLDISRGPTGPRARYGALQDDLRKLKSHFSREEDDDQTQ